MEKSHELPRKPATCKQQCHHNEGHPRGRAGRTLEGLLTAAGKSNDF